jgi:hypothetical protein
MAELDAPGGGSEIPDPTMGTPEHPAGDERGNADRSEAVGADAGREPRAAETLTRGQYADQVRDGSSAEQEGAPGRDDDAGHEPDATRAGGASGADGGLAEPRSRQEVAAEAREGKVFHPGHGVVYVDGREVEATHNAADGVSFGGMGEIPDAPLGDPFGTGRAGEVVASTDEVKMSRLERFNRVVSERLDDIVEQTDHIAETVQDLHHKDPPRPPAPIFTGTAERSPEISPSTADHGVDFGHGLDAALVIGAVGIKMGNWVHEKWQQRARDKHHASN